jgi:VIT1/CCC1 family predicted Fe2+/Mn2+ transporter
MKKRVNQTLVRNFIFGAEDSLVSTVGLLSGVAFAGVERSTIFLTGVILIFVEAFSMGVGSYLTEYITHPDKDPQKKISTKAGIIMFISYIITGVIPLSPYIFFSGNNALILSVCFSLIALICLGILSSFLSKTNIVKNTIRMFVLGGSAIAIGIIVGMLVK